MKSSNPTLSEETFRQFRDTPIERRMTVEGTVNKTLILLLLAVISASVTWNLIGSQRGDLAFNLAVGGGIIGFIVGLVTCFKPSEAPYTAPIYAVLKGLFLGAISAVFNARWPGLPAQAVALTFGTLGVMLMAYRSGLVRATEKFKLGIIAATGGICVFMLFAMVLSLFHINGPAGLLWHRSDPVAILVSVAIVIVAALNLVLDFDFIEKGATTYRAPAYMEWYGAFSLMVTLVWLYVRFLRLLAQLNSTRR